MGKLMYLKKESDYGFAPAIVEMTNKRKYGSTFKVIHSFCGQRKYDYKSKTWNALNEDIRKPILIELLRVPVKSYVQYFIRQVKK